MKKIPWKIALISLLGNIIIALGVSTVRLAKWGIDPFTSMTTGISGKLGISLGLFQASLNVVLFIVLVILDKKNLHYLNFGALVNMFILGYFVQGLNSVYCNLFNVATPEDVSLGIAFQVIIFVVGVLLVTLGCSLYMTANLGTAPYDALSIFMSEKLPIKYAICRIITDVCCVGLSFVFGGPLGISTFVLMCCTGPFVTFWTEHVSKPVVNKLS